MVPTENVIETAVEVVREAAATQSIPGKRVFWALRQLEKAKIPVGCGFIHEQVPAPRCSLKSCVLVDSAGVGEGNTCFSSLY